MQNTHAPRTTTGPRPWRALPTEMKLAVLAHLATDDVRVFSKVDKEAYTLAVPSLWRVSYRYCPLFLCTAH